MGQKLSLISQKSRFVSFCYRSYYCVIILKCVKCLIAVGLGLCWLWKNERRLQTTWIRKVFRLCHWTRSGDRRTVEKKVCGEEEGRHPIIQSSCRVSHCDNRRWKTIMVIGIHLYLNDSWIGWLKHFKR